MHICEVLSTPLPPEEGISNYVVGLSEALTRKGHKVTLVTRGTGQTRPYEVQNGLRIVRPPFYPFYPLHVSIHGLFLSRWLNSLSVPPDLVHFHSPLVPAIGVRCLSVATVHTPLLVDSRYLEIRDLRTLATKLHVPVGFFFETRLFRAVDVLTAVSRHVAKELSVYGIKENRVSVLGSAVNADLFRPGKQEVTEGTILYVGRLTARKGLLCLIAAIGSLKDRGVALTLWIVGKGPLEGYLRRRVRRLGLESQEVVFHGFLPRSALIETYQRSNVVVVPSRYEGLSTTLLEALACGRPVVATRALGIEEVVRDRVDAWLVKSDSPDSLADGIGTVLEDADLQRTLSLNARARVLESYTWDQVADRLLQSLSTFMEDSS